MNTQRNMLSAETPKSVETTSFFLSSSSRNAAITDSKLFYRRSDDPNSTRTAAPQNPVAVEPNEPDKVARALRSLVDGFYARHARTLSGDVGSDPNFSEIQDSGFGASIRTNPANEHGKGNMRNAGNATDVRAHQTFLYCMRILGSRMTPSIVSDELHVADLIKKKLVRDHKSTSKALQFSNLFSRLQSQNILTRKWAILYLLFQISEQTDTGSAEASTSLNGSSMHQSFSYMGLQNLSFTNSQTNVRKQGISPPSISMVQQEYTPCDSSFGKPPKIMMQSQQHRQPRQATEGLTPHARLLASESHGEDVSESALLKDVIFVFQGINGKYVRFDEISESYIIDPKVRISKSNRELIHRLTEIGWLFRRVQAFVKTASTDQTIGLVGQAFCSCLQKELTEYYRLIAVLEAQISRHTESVNNNDTTQTVAISASLATPHFTSPASGLTLKRLMIWTQEPLQKLRLMSVLVDCCAEQTGGALVSLIHTYTKHGDPFIQNFIENTLKEVSQPFYHMLQTWIYEGQLDDPYNEFFVACSSNADEENLWRQKYSMNEEMIPAFISKSLANKIFLIGKSLNFLRYSCQDSDWVALRNRNSFDKNLKYGEIAKLESSIDAAYQSTSRRLLDTLFKRFLLLDQLRALKKYMLLGQGDFVQHLMDLLGPSLDQPATTLFRHNLTGMLETAIRGGNLQYENPEILRRLDVRVLEVSAGDTGWDVFSLDYHVDAPISTIFTPQAMHQYLKMFNVLWRLKRAEHVLAAGWRRQMTSAHSLRGMQEIAPDLHTCSVLYGEMVHFVYQMQYYMLFEVLECSWDELMRYIDKQSGDLDGLYKAHERYLNQIVTKGLLASSSSQNLLGRLMRLFDIISRFRDAQDSLYDHACGEVERLARLGRKAYQRTLQGQWGLTDEDDMSEGTPLSDEKSDDVLREIRTRVGDVSRQFKNELSNLLIGLSTHPDTDLKSLSFRLDYNEYYQKQRQKKTNPGSTSNKR